MQSRNTLLPVRKIIGNPVTALSFEAQVALMLNWARDRVSKVVCIANVHMLIEAHHNQTFASILQSADLVTPDGMPLVWMLRLLGVSKQDRVAGPDVLIALCHKAVAQGVSLFFLGSEAAILEEMRSRLTKECPNLKIAGMEPLPFRPLTAAEDEAVVEMLNNSGAGIVLVSLGCPKQEVWMANHRDRVKAVMVGLGGAFPMYAQIYPRAPHFVQSLGLEWFYRLLQEPRRLWGRYISTIPIFLWLAFQQLLHSSQQMIIVEEFPVKNLKES
jgi:N-acetylglucosaminyldiphosphoundecaprenol N-acetyl-beta-D-mannosaminyltransferase